MVAQGGRAGRPSVCFHARAVEGDAANGHARTPLLRQWLVGRGGVAWRALERDRPDRRRRSKSALRGVPFFRRRLLVVVESRERASSPDHPGLWHERAYY